jgi:2-(1,2-epoxy-1,2-dihydrophenyl)acetyl-CoA isomerase
VSGVQVTTEGGVLRLRLDRPDKRNALTADMVDAMLDALAAAVAGDDVRAVELTAAGDHFCSGYDISGGGNRPAEGQRPRTGHLYRSMQQRPHRLVQALHDLPIPVVAGVQGHASGMGAALALSADVTIAASDATFRIPFVGLGFSPDSGSTFLLPRLVGLARAKQMVLQGRPVGGEQAAAWGLVAEAVPAAELAGAVRRTSEELAGAATVAFGLAKQLLHRNLAGTLEDALHEEALTEELAVRSDDFKEGMRAFAERRPPDYTGR